MAGPVSAAPIPAASIIRGSRGGSGLALLYSFFWVAKKKLLAPGRRKGRTLNIGSLLSAVSDIHREAADTGALLCMHSVLQSNPTPVSTDACWVMLGQSPSPGPNLPCRVVVKTKWGEGRAVTTVRCTLAGGRIKT